MARSEEAIPSQALGRAEGRLALGTPVAPEGEPLAERATVTATRVSSPARDAWRRFRRNWAAMASLAIVIILLMAAVLAPFLHTIDPTLQPSCYCHLNLGPTSTHFFGTDGTGEDIYSRVLYGMRIVYAVGLLGTIITVILGTLIGVIAGYFGGAIDSLFSRLTDLFFAFPAFLLALLTISLFGPAFDPLLGGTGRVILLTIVFSLVSWPPLTRFVRSLALALREQQFVEAARTSGSSSWKILRRHLLPNMVGLILVQAALITVGIVYIEVSLSIFGLGVPPPNPDLGQMLYDGSSQLSQGVQPGFYAEVIFPSIFLSVLLLAFTFIGDGVRDAVDPRMNS